LPFLQILDTGGLVEKEIALYVECRDCSRIFRIRTLCSIPQETLGNPPQWPRVIFPLRAICPHCGHWGAYSEWEVDLGRIQTPSQTIGPDQVAYVLEIGCGEPDCGSRTKWHLQGSANAGREALQRLVFFATRKEGNEPSCCENGHPFRDSLTELHFRIV
jgi:hypothetical protein